MKFEDSPSFAQLVERRVTEMGGRVSAIEKRLGLKPDAIRNVIRSSDRAGPTLSRARELCDALGIELHLGPERLSAIAQQEQRKAIDEFAFVQRFDVKLSAGAGASGDNALELAQVAFRQDWMLQQGLVASKCVVCGVTGDSMEPLLFDGDLVLIDRRKSDLLSGQVYAFVEAEGDIRIKRIEKIDGGILLRSDNPRHPTDIRLGDDSNRIDVVGKLVWSGHTHGALRTAKTG